MMAVQEPAGGLETAQAVLLAADVWEEARSAYYAALRDVAGLLSMAEVRALAEARDIAERELRVAIATWRRSAGASIQADC